MIDKAIFIWIPKTAGTSITEVLEMNGFQGYRWKYQIFSTINNKVHYCHYSIFHLIKYNYVPKKFIDEAFKFTFVRNPYDRLISLFFYLKKREGKLTRGLSFKEFLYSLKKNITEVGLYNVKGNSQANNQYKWITTEIDFIGNYENLQQDFNTLCSILGIEEQELPIKRKTNHKEYQYYYDDETKQLVDEIYNKDFEIFNYEQVL